MPELPEVETVRRILEPQLRGRVVTGLDVHHPAVLAHPAPEAFRQAVRSTRIGELGRRGKFLLVRLDGGAALVIHLRMTGQLLLTPPDYPIKAHTHAVFRLDNGNELRFVDTRRFGRLWLLGAEEGDTLTGIHKLGPEPFDEAFGAAYLERTLGKRRIAVKQALLDQAAVAGIGNIYADESLFAANLHPLRPTDSIRRAEWKRLAAAIPQVLDKAIADNAMTPEEYLAGEGTEYRNTPFFQVYGRAGLACPRCGTVLERIKIAGRGSCYCPRCQKAR
jgi:formamidopyrimidine-DNA glycosylase (fpg)